MQLNVVFIIDNVDLKRFFQKKTPSPKKIGFGVFVSIEFFYYEISDLDWPLSSRTACAAARRATGIRNGEQDT